jgi:hypothetical protein
LQGVETARPHHEAEVDTSESEEGLELALRVVLCLVRGLTDHVQHQAPGDSRLIPVLGWELFGEQELFWLQGVTETGRREADAPSITAI